MSSEEDEDMIASIEEESKEEKDEDESLVSDDDISVGSANDDKTKCKCRCCEKVHRIRGHKKVIAHHVERACLVICALHAAVIVIVGVVVVSLRFQINPVLIATGHVVSLRLTR